MYPAVYKYTVTMERKEYPYVISLDWLSVFCHCLNPLWYKATGPDCNYDIRILPYNSRQFSKIYEIYDRSGQPFAVVSTTPFSAMLNPKSAMIKLENRVLYAANCVNRLMDFMKAYSFQYRNISRIDVCHDSNFLASGFRHKTLIDGFLKNKYEKVGQCNYTLQGSDGKQHEYSYIRFGSRSSGVCAYIYDKTKELREVKNKPYIIKEWERQGINTELPVWRMEISIKTDSTNMLNLETGQYFRLSPDMVLMQEQIEKLFQIYSDKYFHFVRNKGQKKKQNMSKLDVFHWNCLATTKVKTVTIEKDSGRMQKIMINMLDGINRSESEFTEEVRNASITVKKAYIESYGMHKFYLGLKEKQKAKEWYKNSEAYKGKE